MDPDERPNKRTRQACEPCRRKKSKCNGERPGCATCARVRQRCFYADPLPEIDERPLVPTESLQTRVRSLESSLAQVLDTLRNHPTLPSPEVSTPSQPLQLPQPPQPSPTTLPPWPIVVAVARDYLRYCDSQPIPLFEPDGFVEALPDRDPEIVYGVLALAMRFSRDPSVQRHARSVPLYIQAAHRLAIGRVTDGRVELSTIQTLCLLSLIEFFDGSIETSRVHSSLAISLAHGARLHRELNRLDNSPAAEERRRCYWGLVLLRRLLGWPAEGADDHGKALLPLFPASLSSPLWDVDVPDNLRRPHLSEANRVDGILSTVVQLAEVWSLAQDYVRCRGASPGASVRPWSPASKYSCALRTLMDVGKDLPPLHRDRCIRLSRVTADELQHGRAYWAPWFLSHFLYHAAICLLNHPLLMTLQFQGGRDLSEVFLQQTAHLAAHHTSWILHFVDFFAARRFAISDPVLGYCTAVVATIELQQSLADDRSRHQAARANYDRCLVFLRSLARDWPYIERLTAKLTALADQMARHDASSDATLTIDISGFLEILDLVSSARVSGEASSLFGPTLSGHHSHDDPPSDPTRLARLPAISTLDPATATGGRRHPTASPVATAAAAASVPPVDALALDSDDVFLPADQLFGGHLQDANAWWSGTWGDAWPGEP